MSSRFEFLEAPGPHSVGLKVSEQYDHSRAFGYSTGSDGKPRQSARPLQILTWYPAENSTGASLSVSDYVQLWPTETTFGRPRMSVYVREALAAMSGSLPSQLRAVCNAPPLAGRFPLVLYAPSLSAVSWENADLCEYLASHGYIVMSSPSMGQTTREMTRDVAGLETQAADLGFLLESANVNEHADTTKVAAAGFSWGGFSNLLAAARDHRIKALVALDGSMRYFPGLLKQITDVHPEQMSIPLLAFEQSHFSLEEQDRFLSEAERIGPSVLNAWTHGDLVNVHMLGLPHVAFSAMFQRNEHVWHRLFVDHPGLDPHEVRDAAIAGYGAMARYTVKFLDACLKNDSTAKAFLKRKPTENGLPPRVMTVEYRDADEAPPVSLLALRAEAGSSGVAQVLARFKATNCSSAKVLPEQEIVSWARELLWEGQLDEALALLRFNVDIHPDSSNALAELGDGYRLCGQKGPARDSYLAALRKDPRNGQARSELTRINGVSE